MSIQNKILSNARSFVDSYKRDPIPHKPNFLSATLLPAGFVSSKLIDNAANNYAVQISKLRLFGTNSFSTSSSFEKGVAHALQFQGVVQGIWTTTVLGSAALYSCFKSIGSFKATSSEKASIESEVSSLIALTEELNKSNEIENPLRDKLKYVISKQLSALKHTDEKITGTRIRIGLNFLANIGVVASGIYGSVPALVTAAVLSTWVGIDQMFRAEFEFKQIDPQLSDKMGNLESAISNAQLLIPQEAPIQDQSAS